MKAANNSYHRGGRADTEFHRPDPGPAVRPDETLLPRSSRLPPWDEPRGTFRLRGRARTDSRSWVRTAQPCGAVRLFVLPRGPGLHWRRSREDRAARPGNTSGARSEERRVG